MLGASVAGTEPHDSWLSFLQGLRACGMDGAMLAASDAHEGLKRAILEAFRGAAWQRCAVHLMRGCIRAAGSRPPARRVARIVAPMLGAVFDSLQVGDLSTKSFVFQHENIAEMSMGMPTTPP